MTDPFDSPEGRTPLYYKSEMVAVRKEIERYLHTVSEWGKFIRKAAEVLPKWTTSWPSHDTARRELAEEARRLLGKETPNDRP